MWGVNDIYLNGKLIPFLTWLARGADRDDLIWRGVVSLITDVWKVLENVQILN